MSASEDTASHQLGGVFNSLEQGLAGHGGGKGINDC
jgi:hypothetical protein